MDNTQLNVGAAGDVVRTVQRSGTTVKTEVVQLDAGGPAGLPESLVSPANPLPVSGTVSESNSTFDEDGIPYVNPNVPGADIATGDLQRQILASIFGPICTPLAALSFAVGANSTPIVSANPLRKGLVLTNTSTAAQRIALSLTAAAAVLDTGIVLFAGMSWWMDRYSFTTGAVNAIASATGGSLAVQEFS